MLRKYLFIYLLCVGVPQSANAIPFTFDTDLSTAGFQGLYGLTVGVTTFDLLPVLDTTGFINPSLRVGTVTDAVNQDWFLFQIDIVSGGGILQAIADIPGASSVGVSRLGPGYTPTGGGSSYTPPTWDFNTGFVAGNLSDRLIAAYNQGDLSNGMSISFDITDSSQSQGQFQSTIRALQSVPEPSVLALMVLGLTGIGFIRRRKTS